MTLMQMVYNEEEYRYHFYDVLPALKDKRYITVDGKPLFLIWSPLDIPNTQLFIDLWQSLAQENGLAGIHFVGLQQNILSHKVTVKDIIFKHIPNHTSSCYANILSQGYSAINSRGFHRADLYCRSLWDIIWRGICIRLFKYYPISKCDQRKINNGLYTEEDKQENVYPTLMPNWDRTARSGKKARIYTNSTPEVFEEQIDQVLELVKNKTMEHKIVFLMSWNEWAEGNYVEPDLKYGHSYLDAIRKKIIKQ